MKSIIDKNIKKGLYLITEDGKVWSNWKSNFLIPKKDKDGYLELGLQCENGERKMFRIATLVLLTFIGLPSKDILDPTVNHIDSNISNNYYKNLEWMERGENSSIRIHKGKGIENHEAILTEKEVRDICNLLMETNLSYKEIADIFHVEKSTVSNIKRKKNWTNITSQYDLKSCRKVYRDMDGRFVSYNPLI